MLIRKAGKKDIPYLNKLLLQVLMVHHYGRPDLFKPDRRKYTDEQLESILEDAGSPIFVAELEGGEVAGYAFCNIIEYKNHNIFMDMKTLYIDDICVDENRRGEHIGKQLFDYVTEYARENDFYNITLNVWSCNEGAARFYEKCGMVPQKTGMEYILKK